MSSKTFAVASLLVISDSRKVSMEQNQRDRDRLSRLFSSSEILQKRLDKMRIGLGFRQRTAAAADDDDPKRCDLRAKDSYLAVVCDSLQWAMAP